MTIDRIDLLLPPAERAGYGVLVHFTNAMAAALQRQGVSCRVLGAANGHTPDLVKQILLDSPDYTLSFNGLLPDAQGEFLCDRIGIPHIALVVDGPNHFLDLMKSPLTRVASIDKDFTAFFQAFSQQEVLFIPHAVEKDYLEPIDSSRIYDIVLFGTCIDYEERLKQWPKIFPKDVCRILEDAVSICIADQRIPYFQALQNALVDRVDPRPLDFLALLEQVETVMRGRDRVELVRAIQHTQVHLFGTKTGEQGWEHYFAGKQKNVTLHGQISYERVLQVMAQSKIILNSSPHIRNGAHERIFTGLMAGATVITNESPYVREIFGTEKGVLYYSSLDYAGINEAISSILSGENKRRSAIERGRKIVQSGHTWDHRAKALIEALI